MSQSMPEVAKVDVGRQVSLARGGERRDGRVVFEGLGKGNRWISTLTADGWDCKLGPTLKLSPFARSSP